MEGFYQSIAPRAAALGTVTAGAGAWYSDAVKRFAALACFAALALASEARADDHPGAGVFSGWKTSHLAEGPLLGLEPALTRVVAPGSSETHAGGVVAFWAEYFGRSWYPGETKLFRVAFRGSLGADTSGLLGSIAHEAAFGLRLPLQPLDDEALRRKDFFRRLSDEEKKSARAIFGASRHALFARIGYAASLGGDHAFYGSLVEAPRLELGYQLDDELGRAGVELRAEGGLALVGRFSVGDGARSIGVSPAYGARVIVHAVDEAHVELGVKRVDDRGGATATPVDLADAMACLDLGKLRLPMVRAVCGNARVETGDVDRAGVVSRASALYAGMLLSVSWME